MAVAIFHTDMVRSVFFKERPYLHQMAELLFLCVSPRIVANRELASIGNGLITNDPFFLIMTLISTEHSTHKYEMAYAQTQRANDTYPGFKKSAQWFIVGCCLVVAYVILCRSGLSSPSHVACPISFVLALVV
jgi:hypothetical protein